MVANNLEFCGTFTDQSMAPIAEAGVHFTFLGDPPTNCGTVFDLEDAAAKTDSSGHFRVSISDLVESVSREGTADAWRRGCFFVFAVKDCRTMAYTIASGEELQNSPVRLTALPQADIVGRVVDEAGLPVPGARVVVELYMLFVGRGPYPSAPVNFWLSRPNPDRKTGRERDAGLETLTDADGQFRLPQAPMMPQLQLTVSHPRYAAIQTDYYAYQPTLRLVMQPGAEILTRIRLADGNPAVGFQLVLEGDTGLNRVTHRRGATDDAGRCVFECLPAGDYIIRYRGGADDRWAVPAIHAAGLAKGERREIDVEATLGSVLYGRVLEAGTKAPVAHADVRFKSEAYPPTASTFQAAYTDHEGRFEFAYAVVRGALDVTVSAPHKSEWIHQRQRIVVGHEPRTELQFFLTLE